ncbi:perilipin 6 [Hoplias malabaricus]|uniref:perilipin 6 n=1 Tax=Hoplias malabaricus TaxID=27720 RepID=UPI003462FAD5
MTETKESEGSAVTRVVKLPLFSSALQKLAGLYVGVKRRYPLLGIVGAMTELSVHSVSTAASQRAAPLLQRLEPEIKRVNGYALVGVDQLEKNFPILHKSADEVIERLKETFFVRMGDVQSRVNEELDGMVDRWERVLKFTWDMLEAAQASPAGQGLTSGLDELLTRSEEAVDYYLPLPPTLRREWEIKVQTYEDEDGEEDDDDTEPRMWTRIRSLLLFLYLQMYHRFLQLKERVDDVLEFLGEAADVVGLTGLLEGVWSLLHLLQSVYTAQVQRAEALQSLLLDQFSMGAQALKELPPVQQLLTLPTQVRTVMDDLLELGQILIQLLINTTPLYDLLQQSSDQNVTSFDLPDGASRRSSGNSLFLKAMDGRPRRRRSLYARYRRSSSSGSALNSFPALSPSPAQSSAIADRRKGSLKNNSQLAESPEQDFPMVSSNMIRRRSSTRERLFSPIMQFVTQSQRAFEYLSSSSYSEDQVTAVVENSEQRTPFYSSTE